MERSFQNSFEIQNLNILLKISNLKLYLKLQNLKHHLKIQLVHLEPLHCFIEINQRKIVFYESPMNIPKFLSNFR